MYVALMDLFSRNPSPPAPPPCPSPRWCTTSSCSHRPSSSRHCCGTSHSPTPARVSGRERGREGREVRGRSSRPIWPYPPCHVPRALTTYLNVGAPGPVPLTLSHVRTSTRCSHLFHRPHLVTPGHTRRRLDRARLCHVSLGRGGEPDGQPVFPLAVPHEPALQGAVQGGTGEGSRAAVPVATPALISVPSPPPPPPLSTPSPLRCPHLPPL